MVSWIRNIEFLGKKKLILWSVWAFYMVLIIALCSVHEPWYDEFHAWCMVYKFSFTKLLASMRGEGHFCLWHLCIWPLVKYCGMDYHALFVASTLLMSCAVWLLLFKLQFSFIGKLFIIFSSPFFYYFPVIARCYALIPPIIIAIAVVYQEHKKPFLYCFLIGLLAHTHAYMEGMVVVLWGLFVYYDVYKPYKKGNVQRAKINLKASLVTVVVVLFALGQIAGTIWDVINGTCRPSGRTSLMTYLNQIYFSLHVGFFSTLRNFFFHQIPNIDFPITLILYIIISLFLYKLVKNSKNKKANVWIISISLIWQILFALYIYGIAWQRAYLIIFSLLYIVWIVYKDNANTQKYATYLVVCFWLLTSTSHNKKIFRDISEEYGLDISLAAKINSHIVENHPIISEWGLNTALLQRDYTSIHFQPDSLPSILERFSAQDSVFYIITDQNLLSLDTDIFSVKELFSGFYGSNEFAYGANQFPLLLYQVNNHGNNH